MSVAKVVGGNTDGLPAASVTIVLLTFAQARQVRLEFVLINYLPRHSLYHFNDRHDITAAQHSPFSSIGRDLLPYSTQPSMTYRIRADLCSYPKRCSRILVRHGDDMQKWSY
ncbi:hypothetical protein BGZ63DRAFT_390528 [Mariannaea sp. PMI_226]|nr:hypothetical protein BGZ63DRAFT_390528 [Mariannaea sp. PMI_226]